MNKYPLNSTLKPIGRKRQRTTSMNVGSSQNLSTQVHHVLNVLVYEFTEA